MDYHTDYPKKPLGKGNPYYGCRHCGRSDPEINGRLEGHATDCPYRIAKLNGRPYPAPSHDNEESFT